MLRRFAPKHLARTAAAFTYCTRDPSGLKALRMTPSCGGRSLAQPPCNACIGTGALARAGERNSPQVPALAAFAFGQYSIFTPVMWSEGERPSRNTPTLVEAPRC